MVDNDLIYRDNGAGAEDGAEAGAGVAPLEDFDDFELSDIDTPDLNHPHALSHAGMNDGDFYRKEDCGNESRKSRMGSFRSSLLSGFSSALTPPQY